MTKCCAVGPVLTHELFKVILIAYAEPNTEECHIDVRILSMMVVGPKQYAKAKTPNEAAVPDVVFAKQTSSMEVNMPIPQKTTATKFRVRNETSSW